MKKLILLILMIILPLMAFGEEIDCEKGYNVIFNKDSGTRLEDKFSKKQREYCDNKKQEDRKRKEIEYTNEKLRRAIDKNKLLKIILPDIEQTREIEKDNARLDAKYKIIDKEFYGVLYTISHALKEINQTEIVSDIAVTLGNFKKGLIKNGYSEEQAIRVITALLGNKMIPVDM